jgi:hypothetical protein
VPALVLPDLEDGDDFGMVEGSRRRGLGREPFDIVGRSELSGEDHLEGDNAIGLDLPRVVNDPHSIARDLLEQLIAAKVSQLGQPSDSVLGPKLRWAARRLDRYSRLTSIRIKVSQASLSGDRRTAGNQYVLGARALGYELADVSRMFVARPT